MRFARELTSRTWCAVFGLLLVPAVATAQTTQKLTPIVLPIGPPNGSQSDSAIYLNEAGTVVGTILRADGHRDAYSWANGVSVNLVPTTADQNFTPAALNDAGDVAVLELDYTADPNHPTSTSLIWHAGSTSQKPELGSAFIQGINDKGEIVAWDYPNNHALLLTDPGLVDLGIGNPLAVNDATEVLVYNGNNVPSFVWSHGTATNIPDPDGIVGGVRPTAINNKGHVVGYIPSSDRWHAFFWDGVKSIDIGTLGGDTSAFDVNNFDQIVGDSYDAVNGSRPFFWSDGKMTDISKLVDPTLGWRLTGALRINDAGQVVGGGQLSTFEKAYLLDLNCIDADQNGNPDNDGDGLCDNWETDGIDFDHDGVIDFVLADTNKDGSVDSTEYADPNHKDLYVEIDWMAGHKPLSGALARVVRAFASSPVTNPDGATGVRLHLLVDEEATPHLYTMTASIDQDGNTAFDTVKAGHFGTLADRTSANSKAILGAKRLVFRYTLFIHNQDGTDASGAAETPGNDIVVSLGSFAPIRGHARGNVDEQAGTFMHELGHSLGLLHGGGDAINCKPNYLSVMSWSRQFDGSPVVGRKLDYSRQVLATLDESNLNEASGVGGPAGEKTSYVPPPTPPRQVVVPDDAPIDWNLDGDTSDTGVSVDITGPCAAGLSTLTGYEDWSKLKYNFRDTGDVADGAHPNASAGEELSFSGALALSVDSDGDGVTNLIDNCLTVSNPTQADGDDDGVGDACDDCPSLYNPSQDPCASVPAGGEVDDPFVPPPADAGAPPDGAVSTSDARTGDDSNVSSGAGGSSGTGGAAMAGATSSGGFSPADASSEAGPTAGAHANTGGAANVSGASGRASEPAGSSNNDGCGCLLAARSENDPLALVLVLAELALLRRRRSTHSFHTDCS